eukprot:TRINITY_DN17577_c0_g1_i1.p1 TRINITY_DN17577_c0_g1~~TRINITY_DN17577_c0_g1_i1.p1  ORF type:complete len:391 (+),score=43.86 TRINITY_DN17577_c0_g1_i1:548-1720(+)
MSGADVPCVRATCAVAARRCCLPNTRTVGDAALFPKPAAQPFLRSTIELAVGLFLHPFLNQNFFPLNTTMAGHTPTLQTVNLKEILASLGKKDRDIVTIEADKPISHGLEVLVQHKILAVPVIRAGRIVGVLDYPGLIRLLLTKIAGAGASEEAIVGAIASFSEGLVEEVCQLQEHGMDALLLGKEEMSLTLQSILNYFFRASHLYGWAPDRNFFATKFVHRLYVLNRLGTPVQVLSQSDIVRYLDAHPALLGTAAHQQIGELGLAAQNACHPAPASDVALEVLGRMTMQALPAVPVLDAAGNAVSSFSFSDLRGLEGNNWITLMQPVAQFRNPTTLVTCNEQTTLQDLVHMFVERSVHQIYCTDATGKPTGLVTLTDVLRTIADSKHDT